MTYNLTYQFLDKDFNTQTFNKIFYNSEERYQFIKELGKKKERDNIFDIGFVAYEEGSFFELLDIHPHAHIVCTHGQDVNAKWRYYCNEEGEQIITGDEVLVPWFH